ncbi:MAG: penicillin acylase family protein [Candidatus Zixiibacteriota bacterium]
MKKFKWIGGVVIAAILSVIVGMYFYLRSTIPDYSTDMTSSGVSESVTISRDSYGMPHIFAASEKDAVFALGFCSAQDRLFQMDMVRRAIRGQLAEIVGKDAIEIDQMYRTITAGKSVEEMYDALPDSLKELMIAYSNGVNLYLEQHSEKLPIEFSLLGYEPNPWKPADCLTVLYYMAWALNFSYDSELTLAAMINKVGEDMAKQVFIEYPAGMPTIFPSGYTMAHMSRTVDNIRLARSLTGAPMRGASNNWVVSGKKSVTGMPLLANDMHLGMVAPSIWYEAHWSTPTVNVSGVMLAGAPLIVAGANQQVAWGFTNVMADDADYYLEKINPVDSSQFEYKGNWESLDIQYDTIAVLNDSAHVFPIRRTRHGIIVDEITDSTVRGDTAYSIAMRWTIVDFGHEAEGIYRLNKAASIDDCEAAAELFKCPGQNWVYADDQGDIGFWAAVGIPIRNGFDGQSLLPGWSGEYEWDGYLPTDKQPHVRNPERGWMASANNKHMDDSYPYYITHCYAPSERFERIAALLTEKEKLSIDDFKRIQYDNYLLVGERWAPDIIAAVSGKELTETEKTALDSLAGWDYYAPKESVPAAIFHVTWQHLIENTFKPHLGDTLYEYFVSENNFTVHKAMQNLKSIPESDWFDNSETGERETLADVIAESFNQAVAELTSAYGENVADWHWGEFHTLTIFHPIGRVLPFVGGMLNIGPYPVGGGSHSINPSLYRLNGSYKMVAGASQRHIFDLSDIDNSLRIIPTGISGNFMSPHYKDQSEMWLNGDYRPFVLSSDRIEADIVTKMQIIPTSDSTKTENLN